MSGGAILLTGATGFLGMDALARLIERGEEQVVVLVRARDDDGRRSACEAVLARLYDEPPRRGRAGAGGARGPSAGGARTVGEDRERLIGSVDRIIHCAASISFELPLEQAREINVGGVARVIELAREIAAGGSLRRLVHVSTAYVSGRHAGDFGEEDLDVGPGVPQHLRALQERGRAAAARRPSDLPLAIARPSIVVGHRASGWTPVFNVLYWPMRAFERGLLEEVPAREDSIVDFVPVDYVTDGILALLDDEGARGTYNLVAGEQALSAGELVELHSVDVRAERRCASSAAAHPAACRRERRRSCPTSTCAAASTMPARASCSRAGGRGEARSEGLSRAPHRLRAQDRLGQAADLAAGIDGRGGRSFPSR